eukprot:1180274-Prorocentrum_minimum.AAC.2
MAAARLSLCTGTARYGAQIKPQYKQIEPQYQQIGRQPREGESVEFSRGDTWRCGQPRAYSYRPRAYPYRPRAYPSGGAAHLILGQGYRDLAVGVSDPRHTARIDGAVACVRFRRRVHQRAEDGGDALHDQQRLSKLAVVVLRQAPP